MRKINGWHLCQKDLFASEPRYPWESAKDRYNRVRGLVVQKMSNPETKRLYSARAKAMNVSAKANASLPETSQNQLASVLNPKLQGHVGPWMIGDKSFPLAADSISEKMAANKKQFVNDLHKKFCDRYGHLIQDVDDLPPNVVSLEKFCEKLGGCYNRLTPREQNNVTSALKTLRDIARMHRGRKGGDEDSAYLLVLARPVESSCSRTLDDASADGPHAYLICQVSLSPLDICLWKCTVSPIGSSEVCQHVVCPKSFTATLDASVCADSSLDASQMLPSIQTMHQFAFQWRATGMAPYRLMIFQSYEVVALNSICVYDAEHFMSPDVIGKGNDRNDAESEQDEESGNDMITKCISLLKQPAETDRSSRKTTVRHTTDEPRPKRQAKSSGSKKKQQGQEVSDEKQKCS